jgi:predicted transcriptional regulator
MKRAHRSPGLAGVESPAPALGPLESRVLERLWNAEGALTVRDTKEAFPELAYTTLMTTLDRLYRKGILSRRRAGRAFSYQPRCTRGELLGELVSGQLARILGPDRPNSAILSTLVREVGRVDAELLDALDALIQAERRRLKGKP